MFVVALGEMFPDVLTLGMEIRKPVTKQTNDRIKDLREENPGSFQNICAVNLNAMRYLPNFFYKGQLSKIFFLFPDPHFKKNTHRRRIVNTILLSEYAYVLKEGGICYTITDVPDLYEWMKEHLEKHPLFEPLTQEEIDNDPVIPLVYNSSEESKKVVREGRDKMLAVFRRIPNPNRT
eukprot:TRINITY_DN877_c0_g1_i1.p2 TRINITY_DN877_c0_g1~~TRINITY_DN877_c0_g1_i1.p2  ORF type:complete len:178 (-),score=39.41 TRINITY_DN877_c0_g1_i1:27-560(-)